MARGGNPNHKSLPTWAPYTDANKTVMLFDIPCKAEVDPGAELRALLLPGAERPTTGLGPASSA